MVSEWRIRRVPSDLHPPCGTDRTTKLFLKGSQDDEKVFIEELFRQHKEE